MKVFEVEEETFKRNKTYQDVGHIVDEYTGIC
jgi:hypothetical protein